MISQITGKVVAVQENSLMLEVGAIAYEIFVPSGVIAHYKNVPVSTDAQTFHTIQYIEGASGHGNQFIRLVGFRRALEKNFFQLYTSVEGIGYRTALKSLTLPIQQIALAIEKNDLLMLKKLPHIGKRTAEKMVATLKGRMQKFMFDDENQPLTVDIEPNLQSEVAQVLAQVGFHPTEAMELIAKVLQLNPELKTSETMIQEIFKLKNKIS